eukprot:1271935-Prorocentrum_lima.AAC.1
MGRYPDGVDVERQWAISPPCAGLQDVAWTIRTGNRHHMTFRISAENHEWHEAELKDSEERLMTSAWRVEGINDQGAP